MQVPPSMPDRWGDRVGMWSPNHAEWTLVQFATAAIGVILVNVNPAYRTHELTFALDPSGCRWLIAAPTFKTSDYVAMVDDLRGDLPDLERTIFRWSDEWGGAGRRPGCRRWRAKAQKFKMRDQAMADLGVADGR